jgi:hypothetical protein
VFHRILLISSKFAFICLYLSINKKLLHICVFVISFFLIDFFFFELMNDRNANILPPLPDLAPLVTLPVLLFTPTHTHTHHHTCIRILMLSDYAVSFPPSFPRLHWMMHIWRQHSVFWFLLSDFFSLSLSVSNHPVVCRCGVTSCLLHTFLY